MNPVFQVRVSHTAVQTTGRKNQDEMPRIAHAVQQVVVELPRSQLLDVQEDSESTQLQVHFQQTENMKLCLGE